jgi:hypothetical protein
MDCACETAVREESTIGSTAAGRIAHGVHGATGRDVMTRWVRRARCRPVPRPLQRRDKPGGAAESG